MNALRAARVATFTYFGLNGFLLGMWIVHIPTVEQRTGIDHAELGRLLLLLGLGAFIGMRLGGLITDRAGVKLVVPLAGCCAVHRWCCLGWPRSSGCSGRRSSCSASATG